MTDADIAAADKKRRFKKTLFAMVLGGAAGFLAAFTALQLMDAETMPEFGASVEVAVLVGLIYVITALAVAVGVLSPRAGAKFLNVEDAEELQEQRSMLTTSAIGMGAAGIALVVVALGGSVGLVDPTVALVVYAVLCALAVWVSLKSWKLQDELMRAVGRESGAMTFYLVVAIGGTWALLAHLGFVAGPQALDWLTMFWGLMLLACFIVVGKRGMLVMR
ncbi:hypothetical protein [Aurantiacibacter gilvus]|uniref:DUF2178 domain-containing protein n=1 Tax=Aurantiacibacter gilvus TaxID=3139141 RepID=A0ABU9IAP4_9SPHN